MLDLKMMKKVADEMYALNKRAYEVGGTDKYRRTHIKNLDNQLFGLDIAFIRLGDVEDGIKFQDYTEQLRKDFSEWTRVVFK